MSFELEKPSKMVNWKNVKELKGLQTLTVRKFDGDPKLCPLNTLLCYIERTKHFRGDVDAIFVLIRQPPCPARPQTIIRWCKAIMAKTGLAQFDVRSTRSLSSSKSLLLQMPIDKILSKVGWQRATTFIYKYMKKLTR